MLGQAEQAARENSMAFLSVMIQILVTLKILQSKRNALIVITMQLVRRQNEYKPFTEFRNVTSGNSKSSGHASDCEADVNALQLYNWRRFTATGWCLTICCGGDNKPINFQF